MPFKLSQNAHAYLLGARASRPQLSAQREQNPQPFPANQNATLTTGSAGVPPATERAARTTPSAFHANKTQTLLLGARASRPQLSAQREQDGSARNKQHFYSTVR